MQEIYMNNEHKGYGLLIGAGTYQDQEQSSLPVVCEDLKIMHAALTDGLKYHRDNIRILGETDGIVTGRSFARAISEFSQLLRPEDTFILYYSGHGIQDGLCFTDGTVNLGSIVDYIEKLPAGQKIAIIDCCYSGEARVSDVKEAPFEKLLSLFVGKGTAVLASSSPDERSWLTESEDASLYTSVVASVLCSRRMIRRGRISLNEVNEEVRYLMDIWNKDHPGRQQHPVFRENVIGDIAFEVEEYHPYVTQKISAETERYRLHSIKPMSTGNLKRFAAFVTLKDPDDTLLPAVTREIVSQFKNSDVYASLQSEKRFKGRSADAVWCYFGRDAEDIDRSNHFAYTIWTDREDLKKRYYRENRNSEVVEGIYIFCNTSYELVKGMQQTSVPEEDVIKQYEDLAALLISKAETFIKDYEEAENNAYSLYTVSSSYSGWIRDVKQAYFRLTEAEPAPAERIRWAESILDLAGWVVDMALYLERAGLTDDIHTNWMLKNAITRYHRALEKLQLS